MKYNTLINMIIEMWASIVWGWRQTHLMPYTTDIIQEKQYKTKEKM